MEELTAAWVGWLRHRNAVQEKVIALIQRTDARFDDHEELRQSELKRLQQSFYRVAIADKLLETKSHRSWPEAKLLEAADRILEKRGYVPGRASSREMRSPDEERIYGTVRVRWSNLLKKASVEAADPRGGDTSRFRIR